MTFIYTIRYTYCLLCSTRCCADCRSFLPPPNWYTCTHTDAQPPFLLPQPHPCLVTDCVWRPQQTALLLGICLNYWCSSLQSLLDYYCPCYYGGGMALNALLAHVPPAARGKAQVEAPNCIHVLFTFFSIPSLQLLRLSRSCVSQNWLQVFSEFSGMGWGWRLQKAISCCSITVWARSTGQSVLMKGKLDANTKCLVSCLQFLPVCDDRKKEAWVFSM